MISFEKSVLDSMITEKGLRTPTAGNVIAALNHAVNYSYPSGTDSLTDQEVGILRCLLFRMEGRVDPPEEGDSPAYCGTTGLLGWVFRLILNEPEVTRLNPGLHELVARFDCEHQAFYEGLAAEKPRRTADEKPGS